MLGEMRLPHSDYTDSLCDTFREFMDLNQHFHQEYNVTEGYQRGSATIFCVERLEVSVIM